MAQETPLFKGSLSVQWVWPDGLAVTADTPQTIMTLIYQKGTLTVRADTHWRACISTFSYHDS